MRSVKFFQAAAATAVILMAGLVSASAAGNDNGIEVVMNQAKIVKLTKDAATIVVGNPEIVDATVQDARTIVLTGKGFGVTNIVILDLEGAPVVDEAIFVSRNDEKTLRIYRRSKVQTLSCTPFCEGSYKSAAEQTSEAEMGASE
ncbi:MAG: pilus assembly protein N-terminal domain-containing protein [Notoacmeibacter sp.]